MADDKRYTLEEALKVVNDANANLSFKVANKRSKHSSRLADRVLENANVAESLVEVIKELTKVPDTADQVDKLIDITKQLLENNAKLKEQMGEAVQDISD
jgi:tRNA C32,U32 (ribose-2'-O)-methylase TrmJ